MIVATRAVLNRLRYVGPLALLVGIAFLLLGPTQRASAAAALCYNKLGGVLPYECVQDSTAKVAGSKAGDKAPFKADTCYTFADVNKGWEKSDCKEEVFAQAQRTSKPIPAADDPANAADCSTTSCNLMAKIINPLINFFSAVFGIIVTAILTAAGIQYSSSGDDPQKVAAAKAKIINAILALFGFIFLWAFLQWLIPGGLL